MQSLAEVEEEDIRKETNVKQHLSVVQKKFHKRNRWVISQNEWYDTGKDFYFLGLRGELSPGQFRWDQEVLENGKKEGFSERKKLLV